MTAASETVRVMIVDDHAIVRQGLRTFLGLHDGITVVGEACDGADALAQVEALRPDVILMDLMMPRMDGIEAVRRIKGLRPATRVIVLTSFGDDAKLFAALRAGATGFLLKDISPQDLASAVHAARRGEAALSPGIAAKLIQELTIGPAGEGPAPAAAPPAAGHALTGRERDVLALIARGRSNRQIGEELAISEKTVKAHVGNILTKLRLEDRTQAAIYALKEGLVPFDR